MERSEILTRLYELHIANHYPNTEGDTPFRYHATHPTQPFPSLPYLELGTPARLESVEVEEYINLLSKLFNKDFTIELLGGNNETPNFENAFRDFLQKYADQDTGRISIDTETPTLDFLSTFERYIFINAINKSINKDSTTGYEQFFRSLCDSFENFRGKFFSPLSWNNELVTDLFYEQTDVANVTTSDSIILTKQQIRAAKDWFRNNGYTELANKISSNTTYSLEMFVNELALTSYSFIPNEEQKAVTNFVLNTSGQDYELPLNGKFVTQSIGANALLANVLEVMFTNLQPNITTKPITTDSNLTEYVSEVSVNGTTFMLNPNPTPKPNIVSEIWQQIEQKHKSITLYRTSQSLFQKFLHASEIEHSTAFYGSSLVAIHSTDKNIRNLAKALLNPNNITYAERTLVIRYIHTNPNISEDLKTKILIQINSFAESGILVDPFKPHENRTAVRSDRNNRSVSPTNEPSFAVQFEI